MLFTAINYYVQKNLPYIISQKAVSQLAIY